MRVRREKTITLICLAVTAALYLLFLHGFIDHVSKSSQYFYDLAESVLFFVIALSFLWGNFLYQFARFGYFRRKAAHRPASRNELERCYDVPAGPALTVLIPSYKEELHVLQQTILSAALLEHPRRRVVVLIDNPPDGSGHDFSELHATRRMVHALNRTFADIAGPLQQEYARFLRRDNPDLRFESDRLSSLYQTAAKYIDRWINDYSVLGETAFAHHDKLLVERVLKVLRDDHRRSAATLRLMPVDASRVAHEYRRLAALFDVEISSFERKRYENLSHAPNKAMNLNSYIGLMGRSFRRESRRNGWWLVECPEAESYLSIPESDYVLTLDADSVILPDYALRLIQVMEADPRIAVAQTPYSAFPGAPNALERVAGATTDLQYIVHQGFTSCEATYWVGANAVLRLEALRDIVQIVDERGHPVPVFIQDRTVIEDTGSTVDLITRGWRLFNYPQRLAYSATPPDFGSLVIQRRRWANGGLIILPALLRYLRSQSRLSNMRLPEAFMRAHYLCSPALSSFGLLAILLYPFSDNLTTIWLVATAIPYYFLYARDLAQSGYRISDAFRVYTLVLLLLPVNLSGVAHSIRQIITGRKCAFGRTPKISGRTASPPHHVLLECVLTVFLAMQTVFAVEESRWGHAAFAVMNVAAYLYALTRFVGWRNAWTDLTMPLGRLRGRRVRAVRKRLPMDGVPHSPFAERIEQTLVAAQREESGVSGHVI